MIKLTMQDAIMKNSNIFTVVEMLTNNKNRLFHIAAIQIAEIDHN